MICAVTATVLYPDGTPWEPGEIVRYTLQRGSYSLSGHYPKKTVDAVIGAGGEALAQLWVNEEGVEPTRWVARMPNGETSMFSIPVGTASATLEYLKSITVTPQPNNPSLGAIVGAAIYAHNADPAAHPGLGGAAGRVVSGDTDLFEIDSVIVDATAIANLRLPVVSSVGVIDICSTSGFRLIQRSGQQVAFNDDNTTLGEGGYIQLLEERGSISLRWFSGQWQVINCNGNFEVF
jgi:hypothetical protein